MTQRPLPVNLHSAVCISCFDVNILSIDTALNTVRVSLCNLVCIKQCRTEEQHVCCITLQGVCVVERVSACAHTSCAYFYVHRKLMLNL